MNTELSADELYWREVARHMKTRTLLYYANWTGPISGGANNG